MRIARACTHCRESRRRCLPGSTSEKCQRCGKKQLDCSLNQRPRSGLRHIAILEHHDTGTASGTRHVEGSTGGTAGVTTSATTDGSRQRAALVTSGETRHETTPEPGLSAADTPKSHTLDGAISESDAKAMVELYIYYIHDRPHSLFHINALRQQLHDHSLPDHLLYSLCAMGCRFSDDDLVRSRERSLTEEAKRLALISTTHVTIELVQSLIILANLFVAHFDPESEAVFFGMAVRMMQILQLRHEQPSTIVESDVYKRVWWALYMADRWCSAGLGLPRQLDDLILHVDRPMEELVFQQTSPTSRLATADGTYQPSLWSKSVDLAQVFAPIQILNKDVVNKRLQRFDIDAGVRQMERDLEHWVQALPSHMLCTDDNVIQHQERGTGGAFVALHLGYFHYATLLYFQYLEPRLPRNQLDAVYADKCKQAAFAMSRFIHQHARRRGCEAVYLTVAHMAIVSSSVLIHTLLFGEGEELTAAKQCLGNNFEMLVILKQYWPTTVSMIDRLTKFQQQCLRAAENHTHEMDPWMLRFLIEYSLPLDDKPLAVDWSNTTYAQERPHEGTLAQRGQMTIQALQDLRSSYDVAF